MQCGVAHVGQPCVLVVQVHIDPTVNLHDTLFVFSDPATATSWPVDGRRPTTPLAAL